MNGKSFPDVTRLVSWNILEGFHSLKGEGGPVLDVRRLEAAKAVLADLDPDVVVLNEALWCCPHEGYFVDYAQLLGFPHCSARLYDGCWGNAVLSRAGPLSVKAFNIHNRGGIAVRLDGGLTVATYHPHPSRRPFKKAEDFLALLAGETGPVVLCGDFNCISPADNPNREALEKGFSRFSKTPVKDVARFIEGGRDVFDALARMGMRDAIPVEGRCFTMPTDLISLDKTSSMRIDHILVSKHIDIVRGEVVRSREAETASDHRPVLVELLLTAA